MVSNSPTPSGNSLGPRKNQSKNGTTLLVAIAWLVGLAVSLYLISWVVSWVITSVMTTLVNDSVTTFGISATMVILLGVIVIAFILGRGKRRA